MGIRCWHAGWMDNSPASNFNQFFLEKCREKNILFMGGLSGSSLYLSDVAVIIWGDGFDTLTAGIACKDYGKTVKGVVAIKLLVMCRAMR